MDNWNWRVEYVSMSYLCRAAAEILISPARLGLFLNLTVTRTTKSALVTLVSIYHDLLF